MVLIFAMFSFQQKKMHMAVTEELLLPEPEEIKILMSKMDLLLKAIEND